MKYTADAQQDLEDSSLQWRHLQYLVTACRLCPQRTACGAAHQDMTSRFQYHHARVTASQHSANRCQPVAGSCDLHSAGLVWLCASARAWQAYL